MSDSNLQRTQLLSGEHDGLGPEADIDNRPRHVRYGPESNIQAEACATANLLLRLFNLDSAARTDSRRVKNHLAVLCHRVMGDLRWFN